MSRSLHKSTLDFLIQSSHEEVKGNHLRRLTVLASMINSCAQRKESSLEGISRTGDDDLRQSESLIKQAKRWLQSKWTDWDTFFAPYIGKVLGRLAQSGEIVLVMDGTESGQGCATLMLSVIWRDYAIPIVWMSRKGVKGHFSDAQHLDLARQCLSILPAEVQCRVVLLGDGEFDGQGLRDFCWTNEWEFVLRTSLDRHIDCGGEVDRIDSLLPLLERRTIVFVEDACGRDNALLWKLRGFKDPIPLLTNMDLGQMACKYYERRFKIETMFKQLKSAGFQLQKSMLSHPERIQNLIIVLALTFIFTFGVGMLLKECAKEVISPIVRADRVQKMGPIALAKKAFAHVSDLAYYLFSIFSNNLDTFFT
jgi:hypothetical protein